MSALGSLYIRWRDKTDPRLGPIRQRRLLCKTPTIISNNCWGGHCYRWYGLPYLSPTVGMYIMPDDYLRLASRLEHYMTLPMDFIRIGQSRYKKLHEERGEWQTPLGMLGDVEITFLHYRSEDEVLEKWERRKARMDWNHLYFKFSEMNGCEYHHLKAFDMLPYPNKFVFTSRPHPELHCAVYYPGYEKSGQIANDTTFFNRGIHLRRFLNGKGL